MIEVHKNLFVGDLYDFEDVEHESDFYVIQACKEPCHRDAVRYAGKSLNKTHPEYLFAMRGNRLILNMVDAKDWQYFSLKLFDKSLSFIKQNLVGDNKILIHCNQGVSRSPSIALLYLAVEGVISNETFFAAKRDFMRIYPAYNPSGIQDFLIKNWSYYVF